MIVGLAIATNALAEGPRVPSLPQFQREALDLNQRQSQASPGLERDAGRRLDLYHLQMRQRREQQQLQEQQRVRLEGLAGPHAASDTRRLYQQQISGRERQQQMQRFARELEQWRVPQQTPTNGAPPYLSSTPGQLAFPR